MKRTSITDFAQDRDWAPPPTNKVALDVTLGAGDSMSISPRPIEESVVVHIGIVPGEQFGWECAICQEVSGLAYGNDDDARVALHNHKCAAVD